MHVTTHATFPLPSHIIYMKSSQRICACVACSNATFFLDVLHGESKATSRSFAPLFAAAAPHANATAILQMLLRTFPGRILYHSYPHVRMQYDTAGSSLDLNPCFETIDEQVRCAAAHLSRVLYIDLRPLQQDLAHLYQVADHYTHCVPSSFATPQSHKSAALPLPHVA